MKLSTKMHMDSKYMHVFQESWSLLVKNVKHISLQIGTCKCMTTVYFNLFILYALMYIEDGNHFIK